MKNINPELELMEEDLMLQIGCSKQEIQSQCPCDCHPRCVCCQKCNDMYHRFPMPNHKPEFRRVDEYGNVWYTQ